MKTCIIAVIVGCLSFVLGYMTYSNVVLNNSKIIVNTKAKTGQLIIGSDTVCYRINVPNATVIKGTKHVPEFHL